MRPCSLPALRPARRGRRGRAPIGAARRGCGARRDSGVVRPVLLVPQTGLLGGAERVLLDWSRALARPAVLACPPGPLAEAAAAAGLEVVALPARSLRGGPRGAARLAARARDIARLARRHRPAVVVASGLRPVLAAAAAPLHGARLVTVHHDLSYAGAARVAAARGTAVATSSAVARRVGAARVIHPGVDLRHWALPDPAPGPARALLLGALVPVKRVDLALEIAALMPELSLDIAGAPLPGDPPGYAEALHARAARPDSPAACASSARSPTRARRSRRPTACCTARTARRSGSRSWRRSRPGARSWRRRRAGRWRSSRANPAACTGRATPRAPPALREVLAATCRGARACRGLRRRRAARRFAALIETVAS